MEAADAQDITQEIFQSLFATGRLEEISSKKGRLRSFLKAVAKRHVAEFVRHSGRQKRGGDQIRVPFDISEIEDSLDLEAKVPEPEACFDRKWAISLLDSVERQLRERYEKQERSHWFEALFPHLTPGAEDTNYAELADALGSTMSSIKVAVFRMRRQYRNLLRAEIAKTVDTPEQIEEELRTLHTALKRG